MTNFAGLPDGFQPLSLFDQAFANTQNAANLTSGTVASARLPTPTSTTIGAVKSFASVSHQFLTQIGTDGSITAAQPAASDVSGLAPSATIDTTNAANITSGTLPDARLSFVPQAPVATISALKALAAGAYTSVNVLGYYAAGDNGGGTFLWNGASAAADNGGTVIAPNTGSGRWIRQVANGVYMPRMFGARGDGSNDKTFVQNAIDAIFAAGGGTLYFDVIYTVGGSKHANGFSIIDLKSGVHMVGPGGLKLADNTNTADAVFTASFSGTTMTVSAMTSGTIAVNQFLSLSGNVALVQVASQSGGTPGGAGTYIVTAAPKDSAGTSIAGPITVNGINRMVELAGAYNSTSNSITNTQYGITFDYNGTNNCAGGTIWSFNATLTINTGSDILFDGCRFKNNCGSNTWVFGTYQASPTLFRVSIVNCTDDNNGDRINAASVDYSAIFSVTDGLLVDGNRFTRGAALNGAPFEVYVDATITGNMCQGYYNSANIVAITSQNTKSILFEGNTFRDCSVGLTMATLAASGKFGMVTLLGNNFYANVSSPGGPYVVNCDQMKSGSTIDDLLIEGNHWYNSSLSDLTRTTAGISISGALSATVIGNKIRGIPGQGIWVKATTSPCAIEIKDNSLINVGYTSANAALKIGIQIDAAGSGGTLLVQGNSINPISGYTMTYGIKNALSVDNGAIKNNLMALSLITTPVANTGIGVEVGSVSALGYGPSSGGAITQATSKTTGVTLNTLSGQITMNNAALGSGSTAAFTLTNSVIAATDTVIVNIGSGATSGAYRLAVTAVAASSCRIEVTNGSGGSLSEAVVVNFTVLKGSSS